MKRLIYTLALAATLSTLNSYAQQPEKRKPEGREGKERMGERFRGDRMEKINPEKRAEMTANAMQKRLNLSDEQKQKIQQIELDRIRKSDEWRKQDEKAIREKMEARQAFAKIQREKMDKILTEEQRKTLASTREHVRERVKERMEKRPGRPADRIPPPPPAPKNQK